MDGLTTWVGKEGRRLVALVRHPVAFFEREMKVKNLRSVAGFFVFVLVLKAGLAVVELMLVDYGRLSSLLLASIVISTGLLFLTGYLGAWILHIFVKLFGGKGKYLASYQAYVYGSVPGLLVGRWPVVGLVGYVFGLYLVVVGVSMLHKLSKRRVALMVVGLFVLAFVLRVFSFQVGGV